MGRVYQGRLVEDDRTMDIANDATPLFGFLAFDRAAAAPRPQPSYGNNLIKALAIAGATLLLILLCTVGTFLVSEAFCPCTLGGDPAPAVPPQQQRVSISTTSPYDPVSCATTEVTQ